jgi:hypothetical protein
VEQNLKLRLTHVRAEGASIEILNLPCNDVFMSPMRMKALAGALVQAAADCERTIKGRMRTEPVELQYEIRFYEEPLQDDKQSVLVTLVNTFGVGRFAADDLDQVLNPSRHPGFGEKDFVNAERAGAAMVRRGMFVESKGPKGGLGWLLTDAAVTSARRLTKN